MAPIRSPAAASERAVSPLVGVLCLVALTVCLAAVVAAGFAGVGEVLSMPPDVSVGLAVDGDGEIELRHRRGEPLDVREVTMRVRVDGEPLADQPPVPFFSAFGFDSGPEGPFNEKADPYWSVGERATVRVADTNDPTIEGGETVTVTLSVDGSVIATLEATAT